MGREPTSDAEFEQWIRPLEALDVFDFRMAEEHEKRALLERLKAGMIVAVARYGWRYESSGETEEVFVTVPGRAWRMMDRSDETYFFQTGDLVSQGITSSYRYLDIRCNPETFGGLPLPRSSRAEAAPSNPPEMEKKPPANADLKRFCRAILSEWPEAKEDWLREKAASFFPDNAIKRDPFRAILREIRGPGKRGRPPKTQ